MNENQHNLSMGEDQSAFGLSPTDRKAQMNSSLDISLIDELGPSRDLRVSKEISNIERQHQTALRKQEKISHVYSNNTSSAYADDSRGFPIHNLKPIAPELNHNDRILKTKKVYSSMNQDLDSLQPKLIHNLSKQKSKLLKKKNSKNQVQKYSEYSKDSEILESNDMVVISNLRKESHDSTKPVKIFQKTSTSPKTALRNFKKIDSEGSPSKSPFQYMDVLPKFLEVKKVSKQYKPVDQESQESEATPKKQN